MQRKIARYMRRRKARQRKRAQSDVAASAASPRKPSRPVRAPPVKVRTPATTRGGVAAPKSKKGLRGRSRLPASRSHTPLSEIVWQRRVRLAATRWPSTPKPVPSPVVATGRDKTPRLVVRLDEPRPADRKLAAQFAAAARRLRRVDVSREKQRLRDIEWKDRLSRAALGAYQRELTRSDREGIAAERKAAALAADEAEHKAKTTPTRPMSFGRAGAMKFEP